MWENLNPSKGIVGIKFVDISNGKLFGLMHGPNNRKKEIVA
jgi:hypothetical protein